MNSVALAGRLTKDPEVRYSGEGMAVARFSLAVDRPGKEKSADFPNIVCFGKTAEFVEKYIGKGRMVGITGRIQTGSYEKDGRKVYTTDVVADRVEFLDRKPDGEQKPKEPNPQIEGFSALNEDIPF